jgi:hypothetical protein
MLRDDAAAELVVDDMSADGGCGCDEPVDTLAAVPDVVSNLQLSLSAPLLALDDDPRLLLLPDFIAFFLATGE